eukprot:Gb_02103 [translate_table: standard]
MRFFSGVISAPMALYQNMACYIQRTKYNRVNETNCERSHMRVVRMGGGLKVKGHKKKLVPKLRMKRTSPKALYENMMLCVSSSRLFSGEMVMNGIGMNASVAHPFQANAMKEYEKKMMAK